MPRFHRHEERAVIVLLGSARAGRRSEAVARFVHRLCADAAGVSAAFVDVRDCLADMSIPWEPERAFAPWRERVAAADALIIVTPEYNHGYPGELKILLDAAYGEYDGLPALVCGVSSGAWGGARVVEQLKPVLIELGCAVAREALHVPRVGEFFSADGHLADETAGARLADTLAAFFDRVRSAPPRRKRRGGR